MSLRIDLHHDHDDTKGASDVSNESDELTGGPRGLIGRRRFLLLGGAGVAAVAVGAGTAAAYLSNSTTDPRSPKPVGLEPSTGRQVGSVDPAPLGVRRYALAGTDGWVSFPSAGLVGGATGAKAIEPYFPDPMADPGNRTTYAFCFRNVTNIAQDQVQSVRGQTQTCAPLFYSTAGEELWLTMSNLGLSLRPDLVDSHTIHWHGFRNAIPFYDGVPETSISVPIGRDFTYVYRPKDAGTYMYHCHFEDVEHVTMGMHGIVFVKPNPADQVGLGADGFKNKAYGVYDGDASGETRYHREFAIMLSEVDTRAHFNDAHIQATDWTDFHADFWTMNGRAYPDTLEPNGWRESDGTYIPRSGGPTQGNPTAGFTDLNPESPAGRLASQPLSSLVVCAPGERVLIRFVNLGFLDYSIVFPGLDVDVLGRDSRYVPPSNQRLSTDTIQIAPGESRDVFFTAPSAPGDYPFYNRNLSHYTGSADGADAWVGGQRSAIRVIAGLPEQKKPNGWGDEPEWDGEFPVPA